MLHASVPGQNEITRQIESSESLYTMDWERDDFAIMDNLAVAHYAVPGTQEATGLRILHRTTIEGSFEPAKHTKKPATGAVSDELPDASEMRGNRGFRSTGYLDVGRPEPSSSDNTDRVVPT